MVWSGPASATGGKSGAMIKRLIYFHDFRSLLIRTCITIMTVSDYGVW